MNRSEAVWLRILFWVVIANYLAQIPYYLINYYFPSHLSPSITSIVLLGLTLLWFLAGYLGLRQKKVWGYWVLVSYLAVLTLFYLSSVLLGAAFLQLQNPNLVIKIVFILGYLTAIVSGVTIVTLAKSRSRRARSEGKT